MIEVIYGEKLYRKKLYIRAMGKDYIRNGAIYKAKFCKKAKKSYA